MKLAIIIEMDNDAFDNPYEIRRILKELAQKDLSNVHNQPERDPYDANGRIKDVSGNTCGKWTITD